MSLHHFASSLKHPVSFQLSAVPMNPFSFLQAARSFSLCSVIIFPDLWSHNLIFSCHVFPSTYIWTMVARLSTWILPACTRQLVLLWLIYQWFQKLSSSSHCPNYIFITPLKFYPFPFIWRICFSKWDCAILDLSFVMTEVPAYRLNETNGQNFYKVYW